MLRYLFKISHTYTPKTVECKRAKLPCLPDIWNQYACEGDKLFAFSHASLDMLQAYRSKSLHRDKALRARC